MKKRNTLCGSLRKECKRKLRPILSDYGPIEIQERVTDGGFAVLFKNSTTGVLIDCAIVGHEMLMWVGRLQDGELQPPGGEVTPITVLSTFDVESIMALRMNPDELRCDPSERFAIPFNQQLDYLANGLAKCCSDILGGNFNVFAKLEAIVKARARQYAFEEWGERARDFGW